MDSTQYIVITSFERNQGGTRSCSTGLLSVIGRILLIGGRVLIGNFRQLASATNSYIRLLRPICAQLIRASILKARFSALGNSGVY